MQIESLIAAAVRRAFAEGLALFTEGDLKPIIEELKARDRTAF